MGAPPATERIVSVQVADEYDAVPIAPYFIASGADFGEHTAMGA